MRQKEGFLKFAIQIEFTFLRDFLTRRPPTVLRQDAIIPCGKITTCEFPQENIRKEKEKEERGGNHRPL